MRDFPANHVEIAGKSSEMSINVHPLEFSLKLSATKIMGNNGRSCHHSQIKCMNGHTRTSSADFSKLNSL